MVLPDRGVSRLKPQYLVDNRQVTHNHWCFVQLQELFDRALFQAVPDHDIRDKNHDISVMVSWVKDVSSKDFKQRIPQTRQKHQ
jgi:hypothetical protein